MAEIWYNYLNYQLDVLHHIIKADDTVSEPKETMRGVTSWVKFGRIGQS